MRLLSQPSIDPGGNQKQTKHKSKRPSLVTCLLLALDPGRTYATPGDWSWQHSDIKEGQQQEPTNGHAGKLNAFEPIVMFSTSNGEKNFLPPHKCYINLFVHQLLLSRISAPLTMW
jgi:hypothetical protein